MGVMVGTPQKVRLLEIKEPFANIYGDPIRHTWIPFTVSGDWTHTNAGIGPSLRIAVSARHLGANGAPPGEWHLKSVIGPPLSAPTYPSGGPWQTQITITEKGTVDIKAVLEFELLPGVWIPAKNVTPAPNVFIDVDTTIVIVND